MYILYIEQGGKPMYEKELASFLLVQEDITRIINLIRKFNSINDSINNQISERKLLREELELLNKELKEN